MITKEAHFSLAQKERQPAAGADEIPVLLPLSLNKVINVPKKYPRVEGDMDGHWWQWVDACIAGYGNAEVDSPFEGYAGPLTETVLMGNLLLRSFNIREKVKRKDPVYGEMEGFVFPDGILITNGMEKI